MHPRTLSLAIPLLVACAGTRPVLPPLAEGELVAACPESPNCVSTAASPDDAEHHAEPIPFQGDVPVAKARMKAVIAEMPRTALVAEGATSLDYTFTSKLMGFVDDVQLVFVAGPTAAAPGRIEYRSASRVGRGDMGVNRARMEAVAAAWEAANRAEAGSAR
ncbi:MAG: DUF1499 domain-containing protein [Pseudomonadota bacterium]|nr:DUF1499 domain-containing protein [Pseudomonadota bacterium]